MARAASSASRRARSRSVPRRGASAARAPDRTPSYPIACAASSASRRLGAGQVGGQRGQRLGTQFGFLDLSGVGQPLRTRPYAFFDQRGQ